MSEGMELARFMYGDVQDHQGFWYSLQLWEIDGLTEKQLYWTPGPKNLPIIWQIGHIAHRERSHIGIFLQGLPPALHIGRIQLLRAMIEGNPERAC